eukprot:10099669-Alexandrium_andersonii.AAC.1
MPRKQLDVPGRLRIGSCGFGISHLRRPSTPAFVDGFGVCASSSTGRTPRSLKCLTLSALKQSKCSR